MTRSIPFSELDRTRREGSFFQSSAQGTSAKKPIENITFRLYDGHGMYGGDMHRILLSPEFEAWFKGLEKKTQIAIAQDIKVPESEGTLAGPTLTESKIPNSKT